MNRLIRPTLALLTLIAASSSARDADATTTTARGGPVILNAAIRVIMFGDAFVNHLDPAWQVNITDVFNRPQFYDVLRQYDAPNGSPGNGHIESFRVEPHTFKSPTIPGTACTQWETCALTADIGAVVAKYAAIDPVDANSLYLVIVPDGVVYSYPVSSGEMVGGYHDALQASGAWQRYATAGFGGPWDLTNASHEVSEAITDPYPDDVVVKPAYYNPEIGDLCENAVYASIDGIQVQQEWSEKDHGCVGYAGWEQLAGGAVSAGDGSGTSSESFVVTASGIKVRAPANAGAPIIIAASTHGGVEYDYSSTSGVWSGWLTPGNPGAVKRIAAASATARNFVDLLAVGGDDQVYWKPAVNAASEALESWSLAGAFTAKEVAVTTGGNVTTLFALGTDGVIRYQPLDATNDPTTTGWFVVPGMPASVTKFAVGNVNGMIEVVAAANDVLPVYLSRGYLQCFNLHCDYRQGAATALGTRNVFNATETIEELAVSSTDAKSAGGARLAIFAATSRGVFRAIDDATDKTKIASSWTLTGLPTNTRHIAVARNGDGRLELFGVDPFHHVWHVWQQTLGDADWTTTPAQRGGGVTTIQAFTWPSGMIEIFGFDPQTQSVAHDWQLFRSDGIHWMY